MYFLRVRIGLLDCPSLSHSRVVALVLVLEWFSVECRKIKMKVTTLANHNRCRQSNQPIRTQSEYILVHSKYGKHMEASHNWFCAFAFASDKIQLIKWHKTF